MTPTPLKLLIKPAGRQQFTHICNTCQCGGYGFENDTVYCLNRECPEFNGTDDQVDIYAYVCATT